MVFKGQKLNPVVQADHDMLVGKKVWASDHTSGFTEDLHVTRLFMRMRSHHDEVNGAAIRSVKGELYIVIYLTQLTAVIKKALRSTYEGNKVMYEVIGSVQPT